VFYLQILASNAEMWGFDPYGVPFAWNKKLPTALIYTVAGKGQGTRQGQHAWRGLVSQGLEIVSQGLELKKYYHVLSQPPYIYMYLCIAGKWWVFNAVHSK
jgi:hypothetical protein